MSEREALSTTLRRPNPPGMSAHSRFVKVSSVGQLTVPAPVLRRWDMQHVGGKVEAVGTDKFLVLSKPPAIEQLELDIEDNVDDSPVRRLGTYTISTSGQVTMPAEYRRQWGLRNGGRILFVDFEDAIGFTLPATMREIREEFFSRDAIVQALHTVQGS